MASEMISLLLILSSSSLALAACPSGFEYLPGLGCYMFDSDQLLTWSEALDYCGETGGFLVHT